MRDPKPSLSDRSSRAISSSREAHQMVSDNERYAMVGYALATELMRRRRAGKTASAAELERAVLALIAAKPASRFRQFIADEVSSN